MVMVTMTINNIAQVVCAAYKHAKHAWTNREVSQRGTPKTIFYNFDCLQINLVSIQRALYSRKKIRTSILIRLQHFKELSMVVLVHPGRSELVLNVSLSRAVHFFSSSLYCTCTFVFGECNDI